jgi:GNAT superfamily N-acetyltransferase
VTPVVRPRRAYDEDWVHELLTERWGSTVIVTNGRVHDATELPGLVASDSGRRVGLLTYAEDGAVTELVTVDAVTPGAGVGALLVEAAAQLAAKRGASRLRVVTTNDNLEGLGFYQRNGFVLVALRPEAATVTRLARPDLPEVGRHGIPLRDELELSREL